MRVSIYVAATAQQAYLLRNRLADYGITAQVVNDSLATGSDCPTDWSVAPRVLVDAADAEFAREVAEDFEAALQRGSDGATIDLPGEPLMWEEWPRCPRCRRLRQTLCPSCGSAGTNFPLAEFMPPPDPDEPIHLVAEDPVLLVCATCDQVFEPQFYRHCEQCDYDFGRGLTPPRESFMDESRRQVATTFTAVVFVAIWLYLAWKYLAN